MQHRPAPVKPVHVPKEQSQEERAGGEWDQERRKLGSREFEPPVPGGPTKGSWLALFLILLCFQRVVQVKATEMSSICKEDERKVEAGKQMREEAGEQIRQDLGHRVEWHCREWEARCLGRNPKTKKKQPREGPKYFRMKQPGKRSPGTLVLLHEKVSAGTVHD